MKLRRIRIENVRSFLQPAELLVDGDISIIIGPNGGGKTNLLDIITTTLRRHLLISWVLTKTPQPDFPDRYEFSRNDAFNSNIFTLEPHSQRIGQQQNIEIELEVTVQDLKNMARMRDSAIELTELTERKYVGVSLRFASSWDLSCISLGQRFTYQIVNNSLQSPTDEAAILYQQYLSLYEVENRLRDEIGQSPLSMPMVSLPVNRAGATFQSSLSLANHNEYSYKKSVDAAISRAPGSIISLAVGRIARRYRLLLEQDSGNARTEFYSDEQIRSLTSILKTLGYNWELVCIDALTNQYDLRLEKQGSSFLVNAASSGEKELLTYLFAIYALNVRDALIVVDEPELHLHPKWQSTLLELFEKLSTETGNQFLLATHSPIFVSPASVQYVSRVFSTAQHSEIVRLKNESLPESKHLFSIVNSLNNERMFFADKVVLVEGISDRLFFNSVFQKLALSEGSTQICEVISVGGKGFFAPYELILKACHVPYAVIADLDYVNQLGTPEIKSLFSINEKNIHVDVINNPKSQDGRNLITLINEAITSGNMDDLKIHWEYIKGRQRKLRGNLNEEEQVLLDQFITSQREHGIFILSKGDLETYLPEGYRSKDLEKLIHLVNDPDFWDLLADSAQTELSLITDRIKSLSIV
ncbi:AAA family ATPase [Pseudanabaena sp. UWO311]|uniref:ATP-dependent nuclease n=1 Tax=Pseudanabaena sp. UWO311 TaxID=2487337 RepID=UPI00115C2711|nr:AAA family ATPase [Pseudanabaena sp. UWO311]TYQ23418.1 AAA family ATPase [Pseudanabaena sp. UWO311]